MVVLAVQVVVGMGDGSICSGGGGGSIEGVGGGGNGRW